MKVKNFVLGVAIMIVAIAVVVYGINTFYEKPMYEDFCEEFKTMQYINNSDDCVLSGGRWNDYEGPNEPKDISGWCDRDYICRQDYDDARKSWSKNVFVVVVPLGIAIIALGALVFGLEVVGAGLMAGGVGTILYGIGSYWQYTENWFRFLISLVGLVFLIWLSYYFNRKFGKK